MTSALACNAAKFDRVLPSIEMTKLPCIFAFTVAVWAQTGDKTSQSAGVASWGAAHLPTVQFTNDAHFNNDLVVWRKGHIEIMRGADKVADLGYTGGGYGEGAAKRGIKIGLNELTAAVSRNRKNDVLSTGWEITTAKGTYSTAVMNAKNAPGGITQKSPYGLEGEAVAATQLFRKQVDPGFTYPGFDKLCADAGVNP